MKESEFEPKKVRIMSRLLTDHPFYGAIASSMRIVESEKADRLYTDGNSLLVNPIWFRNAGIEECAFEFSKAALKIALLQQSRMKNRVPLVWNLAMESVCDSILHRYAISDGITLDSFSILAEQMSVDEFYTMIVRTLRGSQRLEMLEKIEKKLLNKENLSESDVFLLKDIMNIAEIRRKDISWFIDRYGDMTRSHYLYRPKYSGKMVAAERAEAMAGRRGVPVERHIKGSYAYPSWIYILSSKLEMNCRIASFSRIRRKYQDQGIVLPSFREKFSLVNIAIDASASIDDSTFSMFSGSVIEMLTGNFGIQAFRIFQTDAGIRSEITIEGRDIPQSLLVRKGEGGTDFRDLFRHLENTGNREPLIVLTDGKASVPEKEPEGFRTYWITTDHDLPWGENIKWDLERLDVPSA
ncbi:MAG: VWA-like domain-containing protein [Candidatus Thermoplasmatota archaeon]|nr:VWA-like domain-containing protein [Candidatus Thermoplasmatota archaeon]